MELTDWVVDIGLATLNRLDKMRRRHGADRAFHPRQSERLGL